MYNLQDRLKWEFAAELEMHFSDESGRDLRISTTDFDFMCKLFEEFLERYENER